MDKKSILEMARGAIQERADYEMSKVIDNILTSILRRLRSVRLLSHLNLYPMTVDRLYKLRLLQSQN